MLNNKYLNLTNLCLFGTCYGVIRSEFYHRKTLKKANIFNDYKLEQHTITNRIKYGMINILFCQFIGLPFIILEDLHIFEKK